MIKLQIIGNLGADAQIQQTQSGDQVINFTVAHSEKDKQGNQQTTWVRCSKFVRQGESTAVAQYLKKGTKVFVEGKPKVNQFTNQAGQTQASLDLLANMIELLGGQQQAQAQAQPLNPYQQPAPAAPTYQPASQPAAPAAAPAPSSNPFDSFSGDVPF